MQSLLLKTLVTASRKRVIPYLRGVDARSSQIKLDWEDGSSKFLQQHAIKYGKELFSVIEVEKFSGAIHNVFELHHEPGSHTATLRVFARDTDSTAILSIAKGLARELQELSESKTQVQEAIKSAYYRVAEFIPRRPEANQEPVFEKLQSKEPAIEELPEPIPDEKQVPLVDARQQSSQEPGLSDRKKSAELENGEPMRRRAEPLQGLEVLDPPVRKDRLASNVPEGDGEVNGVDEDPWEGNDKVSAVVPTEGKGPTAEGENSVQESTVAAPEKPKSSFGLVLSPSIPASALKLFESKFKWAQDFNNINAPGWKETENKDGLRAFEQTYLDFIRIISFCRLPFALEELAPFMKDPNFRLKYDSTLKSIDILVRYTEQIGVLRTVVKGQFPVSDREFINYVAVVEPDENTLISLSYDATDYNQPAGKGTVRGELEMGGSILKRVSATETDYIMLVSTDPKIKGVPNSIIRSKAKQTAQVPKAFCEAVKKEKKSKK